MGLVFVLVFGEGSAGLARGIVEAETLSVFGSLLGVE